MTTDAVQVWAGFWPRVGAWIIDTLLMGVVLFGVGWLAIDYVAGLGSNGRLVGLVVGTLYCGILSSGVGGGCTLGQRLLKLRVVRMDGKPLGLLASFWRAAVLVAPLMLNGWFFDISDPILTRILGALLVTVVFGVGMAQVYLLIFNAPTRRLVHDLVSGAAVVRSGSADFAKPKGVIHGTIASLLVLLGLVIGLGGLQILENWQPKIASETARLTPVMAAVNALPEVAQSSVYDNTMTVKTVGSDAQTTRTLIVTARVNTWPKDVRPLMAKIGAATVKAYKFAPDQRLTIRITYGFDLGLANYSKAEASAYSPQCTSADVKCLEH
ncbi:MAG: RDD family protein [Asticcacaulis sp.]